LVTLVIAAMAAATSYNDIFDVLRLALKIYHFENGDKEWR